uniref:Methyltransferase domain-containing protein n=1 Tax=Chrysotila carterae TaxID=13221 RepID=A0A7S4EVM4_CHRCT|mmetsp:Transcript_39698/g.87150  ORF Transcript_39698/g.87150 Transcript_39698/m.87150 type:complete len:236 (+) Transcript_39698:84-791(+)
MLALFFGIALSGFLLLAAMRCFMAPVYDFLIVRMTAKWYLAVIKELANNAHLLDVGIGTATALAKNATLLQSKKISVVGIDYEAAYIKRAKSVIQEAELEDLVSVHCKSVYDEQIGHLSGGGGAAAKQFTDAYFSGSLTLMPDPPAALRAVASLLRPGGRIYITQTFQNRPSPLAECVKPMLRWLTTIDFGAVTYHSQVTEIVKKAGLKIVHDQPIEGSIDTPWQTARMIVLCSL